MESRKLKRYDSAPISTGTSAAAAARAAAHISNIPRPQPSNTSTASSKPMINATANSAAQPSGNSTSSNTNNTTAEKSTPESYEKQLEAYYRCMEEDNQALATYYETHTMDIASLKVLAQERKYKESVFRAMESKVASMDAFMQELADLLAPSRGLRSRHDANVRNTTASSASVKSSSPNNNNNNSKTAPTPAASMDGVRDAAQRLQAALQTATTNEEKHKLTIQALEREVAELKREARARFTRTKSGTTTTASDVSGGDDGGRDSSCFLPGTAKELRETQRRVRELERRLTAATTEAKDAAAAVQRLEQQHRVTSDTLQRREEELAAMRGLLNTKEQLLTALEEEAKSTRASTATPRPGGSNHHHNDKNTSNNNARYARTNSAPAGAAAAPQHRFGGETSSDRLVVTHHYRLLGGQRYVEGQTFSAESFKDAFSRSVSTLLRVPYGYLTSVEVRTHSEAVSVELDIRHSSRVREDEIDYLLLSHDYPEVMTYLEKAQAELASKAPQDRQAVRVQELQSALAEKEQEVDYLRRKLRALEESVERRDSYREVLDKDVDAALQETESTVKDLYAALQVAQQEAEAAQKALAAKGSQARALEQAKQSAAEAAAAAERNHQQALAKLHGQLSHAEEEVQREKERQAQAILQVQAEERMELAMAVFRFDIPLATSSSQRMAALLLQDAQQTRVLHALALAHAGRTGGAIPVQVKRCAVSENNNNNNNNSNNSSGSVAVLAVDVELAYYANKRTADAAQVEIQRKLKEGGSCTSVQEYLRMRSEAARREAAAVADAQRAVSEADQRATAAIAAVRAETQAAHTTKLDAAASQLRDINARVNAVIPGSGSSSDTPASTVARVDQLLIRLTTAEAAARQKDEEAQRALRRLADAQQEREQLQQTLSELTARCTEVRVAKEQLASRLTTVEEQLKAAAASSSESESVLAEKVRRLESALRAKTTATDAEREKWMADAKAAAATAAARVVELEEVVALREKEVKRLQLKVASAAATGAASNTAAAKPNAGVSEEAALREALRIAKDDRHALVRQVKEMETDMNDLSNIQAAMQRELESAQQELRAKKHDFDLLVKQLIRMEEKEKKWNADQQQGRLSMQQQQQQQQCPKSPDSPTRQAHDEDNAEKDDVARESLVVLTNSNTSLQQCLRKLQRTMKTMGLEVNVSAVNTATEETNNGSGRGTRRSGHRKGALAATVSRAANDHQQLSAQLSELLLHMLNELESGLAGDCNSTTAHGRGQPSTSNVISRAREANSGGGNGGAAFARTASYHSNPNPNHSHNTTNNNASGSAGSGASTRIVKQHLSNSPFARTRSTPVLVERVSEGTRDDAAAATPKQQERRRDGEPDGAAWASPSLNGSPGKATVDAAPRLDFHRQGSSRAYVRSNTATAAAGGANAQPSGSGTGGRLPPSASNANSGSGQRGGGGGGAENEKERRSRELPQRRTGSGASNNSSGKTTAAVHGGSHATAPRRHAPSTTTTTTTTSKSNPFRRSNTATGGASAPGASHTTAGAASNGSGGSGAAASSSAAGGANFMRMNSNFRRTPTNTTDTAASACKPYRMRF